MKTIKEQTAEIAGVYAEFELFSKEYGHHHVINGDGSNGETYGFLSSMRLTAVGGTVQGCILAQLPSDLIAWDDFDTISELRNFQSMHKENIFTSTVSIKDNALQIKLHVQATN